jgi:hypothetical protein
MLFISEPTQKSLRGNLWAVKRRARRLQSRELLDGLAKFAAKIAEDLAETGIAALQQGSAYEGGDEGLVGANVGSVGCVNCKHHDMTRMART